MNAMLVLPLGVALDRILGEPPRFHPLVGFGALAKRVEIGMRRENDSPDRARAKGIVAVVLLLVPFAAAAALLVAVPYLGAAIEITVLYLALGGKSLEEHARAVSAALASGDIAAARASVGKMVSRDTQDLDAEGVARAAVESVLENGNDAVFAALFWFALFGAPAALLYRLANTLDAMWGYRTARYLYFGWCAARLDDVLNYVPARLTALGYALVGDTRLALRCWREQARRWYSPNAGPVMSAGAGALRVSLGGAARYGGLWKERPALGCGATPEAADIGRAIGLVRRATVLWVIAICAAMWGLQHA